MRRITFARLAVILCAAAMLMLQGCGGDNGNGMEQELRQQLEMTQAERDTAEQARMDAEAARDTAEQARMDAEAARDTAEEGEMDAEAERDEAQMMVDAAMAADGAARAGTCMGRWTSLALVMITPCLPTGTTGIWLLPRLSLVN